MSERTSATLVAHAPSQRAKPDDGLKLSLLAIDNHGLIHARAEGSITSHDFPAAGVDPLEALLGANWKAGRVVLDFSSVRYVDSSAVGWLIGAQRAFREGGGRLVLHSVQPMVRQIFDVLKVGRVVPMAEDLEAARQLATVTAVGGAR
jgi:anti-anti-sigma factor